MLIGRVWNLETYKTGFVERPIGRFFMISAVETRVCLTLFRILTYWGQKSRKAVIYRLWAFTKSFYRQFKHLIVVLELK